MHERRKSPGGVFYYAGLPWALGRLREACKLNLTLGHMDCDGKTCLESDVARALTQAAQGLTCLNILVRSFAVWP